MSLATVDRVLNDRPGVRGVTKARVEAAIVALGYVRDVAAANLAKSRIYPRLHSARGRQSLHARAGSGDTPRRRAFRRRTHAPFRRHGSGFRSCRLPAAAIDAAVTEGVAGIAAVAVDAPEVFAAIGWRRRRTFPSSRWPSDLSGSGRDHFIGVDNIAAGRTAGSLMGLFPGNRPGPVVVLAGSMRVRDHGERLEGLFAAMAAMPVARTILPVLEGQDDPTFPSG